MVEELKAKYKTLKDENLRLQEIVLELLIENSILENEIKSVRRIKKC